MRQLIPIIALLISTLATPTLAAESFKLGELGFAGNGCPAPTEAEHTTIIRMSENTINIIPTEMTVLQQSGDRSLQRKKCDIALSVNVTDGYQIRIINTQLQAFSALDTTSTGSIFLEAGFAGESFAKADQQLTSNTVENTELSINETPWSKCGSDVNVRAKASMILRSDLTQSSYMRVNGFSFTVESQACSVST